MSDYDPLRPSRLIEMSHELIDDIYVLGDYCCVAGLSFDPGRELVGLGQS